MSKGRSTSTNLHLAALCRYECSPEYLPEAMDDKEGWRERVRDIRSDGTTWLLWCSFPFYNNYLLKQLLGFKYLYLTLTIFKRINLIQGQGLISYYPPDQSGDRSNGNERKGDSILLRIPEGEYHHRIKLCHIRTLSFCWGVYLFAGGFNWSILHLTHLQKNI